MRLTRSRLGAITSVLWLLVAGLLLVLRPEQALKMTPNEWGDFFAGVFAPLAFLWLVLGYLQQGEELRLSSEALRLQAEELRNSVEQQRALVEVSRQQVESEREALAFERKLREDLSLPRLAVIGAGGSFSGSGRSSYNFLLSNSGHAATELSVSAVLQDNTRIQFLKAIPIFEKGSERHFTIERDSPLAPGEHKLLLEFEDGLGRQRNETFIFSREANDTRSLLSFRRAEA